MRELEESLSPGELIDYIKYILQIENDARKARYTEYDEAVFKRVKAAFEYYLIDETDILLQRPEVITEEWSQQSIARGVRLRKLFAIRTYSNTKWGEDVFRAYVGPWNDLTAADSYESSYFFRFVDEKLRLFSIYDIDRYSERLGHRFTGLSLTWVWQSGEEIDGLGECELLLWVEEPGNDRDLEEYHRID